MQWAMKTKRLPPCLQFPVFNRLDISSTCKMTASSVWSYLSKAEVLKHLGLGALWSFEKIIEAPKEHVCVWATSLDTLHNKNSDRSFQNTTMHRAPRISCWSDDIITHQEASRKFHRAPVREGEWKRQNVLALWLLPRSWRRSWHCQRSSDWTRTTVILMKTYLDWCQL